MKERELNPTGRLFIKQRYEQRLCINMTCQTCTEVNLAKSILPYFEEQTMTDSELEQMKKSSSHTRSMGDNLTNTNLDLEKWNLCFRQAFTGEFGVIFWASIN